MDSNSQPYSFTVVRPEYYCFTTDSGDEYECTFMSYREFFINYPDIASRFFVFNLNLVNPPVKQRGSDKRIAATVTGIVLEFLLSKVNAVVYVCDPGDGRAAVRARKFKSWYQYFEHSKKIIRLNTEFKAGGMKFYTAMFVHKHNKLKKRFIQAYLEFAKDDNK